MKGQVTSLYDPALGRILFGPDGIAIPTQGTLTHGVNEGIAYAVTNGWAFKCLPHEEVNCTDAITIPPCAHADIDLGSTEFSFGPGCSAPALTMNSFNGGSFRHTGRMSYEGTNTNAACLISPSTNDPRHGQKIIQNASIEFGWIDCRSAVDSIAQIDLSHGDIHNNQHFDWQVLQGWDGSANKAKYGLLIFNPTESTSFTENFVRIGQCAGFWNTGVMIGFGQAYDIHLSDNRYELGINSLLNASNMLATYGSYDEFDLGMTKYGGNCDTGIKYMPGSTNNRHMIRQCTATNPVQDNGTGNRAI